MQDVDYAKLKTKLERDGQRLAWGDQSVGKPAKPPPGLVTVTVSNRNTDGFVVVDGVQLLLQQQ